MVHKIIKKLLYIFYTYFSRVRNIVIILDKVLWILHYIVFKLCMVEGLVNRGSRV